MKEIEMTTMSYALQGRSIFAGNYVTIKQLASSYLGFPPLD
jgi:hypothetical protein